MVQFNEDGKLNGTYPGDARYFESFVLEADKLTIYTKILQWEGKDEPNIPGVPRAVNKRLHELAIHHTDDWPAHVWEMYDVYYLLSSAGLRAGIDMSRVGELCRSETRKWWEVILYLTPEKRTPWADWPKQPTA
jgi:hypothetical protein